MHELAIVTGEDWKAAMMPFSLRPDPLNPHVQFVDTEDQGRLEFDTASTNMLVLADGTLLYPDDMQTLQYLRGLTRAEWKMEWEDLVRQHKVVFGLTDLKVIEPPPGAEMRSVPFRDIYLTFEDFMWDWHGDELSPETTRFGRWENPGGEWDWCVAGGRWAGFFIAKPGRSHCAGDARQPRTAPRSGRFDRMRRGDVDFGAMEAESHANACEIWDDFSSQVPPGLFDGFEDRETVRARHPGNRLGEARAWAEYQGQPVVTHVRDRMTLAGKQHSFTAEAVRDALAEGRSTFADRCARICWVPVAIVADGHWHACPDEDVPGRQSPSWIERARHLVLSLPDDTVVTAVDYHW